MPFQGQDFLINSTTDDVQFESTQTVFGDGHILVTWRSDEGADFPNEVRARILNPDGSVGSPDFIVNTTAEDENQIVATTLPNGNVLVTWSASDLTTGVSDIHARVVESDGTTGPEFVLNSGTNSAEVWLGVATLANGQTLVATTGYSSSDDSPDIVGHLINADGGPTESQFTINSGLSGLQFEPTVAAMPDGDAFVTWVSSTGKGDDVLYGRILNPDGSADAPDFQISSSATIDQLGPQVTAIADGNMLVTWTSGRAIEGRIFDSQGGAIGRDFLISDPGSLALSSANSSVTALADGRALVVWEHRVNGTDGTSDDLYARVVNADGTMSSPEFMVNSATGLDESAPHVTELPNGEIFVTWTSGTGEFLVEDIQGRLLTLDNTISGTAGNDALHGGAANDEIFGAAGNDSLTGGAGDDILSGGTGHNALWGNDGNDTFLGGTGTDSFAGGLGSDSVQYDHSSAGVTVNLATGTASGGDAAGDTLNSIENVTGSAHNDTLIGDAAASHLAGGGGNDALTGNDGDDLLQGGSGNDQIWGNNGNDTLAGGSGADTLSGGSGIDTADYTTSQSAVSVDLTLGAGTGGDAAGDKFSSIENVIGSAFNDQLTGNSAANQLSGGAGNDILVGGAGQDVLTGGAGADVFVFKTVLDSATGHADQILDFSSAQGDHIDLSGIDANTTAGGDEAFGYIGSAAFTGVAGQLRYADQVLQGDVNGDGVADFGIHVAAASLANDDLIL